jgi:hypothetical protein
LSSLLKNESNGVSSKTKICTPLANNSNSSDRFFSVVLPCGSNPFDELVLALLISGLVIPVTLVVCTVPKLAIEPALAKEEVSPSALASFTGNISASLADGARDSTVSRSPASMTPFELGIEILSLAAAPS